MTDRHPPSFVPSRRDVIFGGALALTAGAAFAAMPRRRQMEIGPNQLDSIVPHAIGPWRYQSQSGLILPPPDQLARLLYDQQVTRYYQAAGALPVMLLMAYGNSQSGMLQVHRPEICYPASGFRLTDQRTGMLPIDGPADIPIRTFTAISDTRVERVLYWTRIGESLPASWVAQRVAVMRSNLNGVIPDGLLVRISTVSEQEDQAMAALSEFGRAMLRASGPRGRRMLIGATT